MSTKNLSEQIVERLGHALQQREELEVGDRPAADEQVGGAVRGHLAAVGEDGDEGLGTAPGSSSSEHGYRVMGRPGVDTVSARPAAARWRRLGVGALAGDHAVDLALDPLDQPAGEELEAGGLVGLVEERPAW